MASGGTFGWPASVSRDLIVSQTDDRKDRPIRSNLSVGQEARLCEVFSNDED
jgi:hypothetical protein